LRSRGTGSRKERMCIIERREMVARLLNAGWGGETPSKIGEYGGLVDSILRHGPRVVPLPPRGREKRTALIVVRGPIRGCGPRDSREISVSLHTPGGEGEERVRDRGWDPRGVVTTAEVAGFFRQRSPGARAADLAEDESPTMAPVVYDDSRSFAVWPMGGEKPPRLEYVTKDHNWSSGDYEWYDLAKVAVGSSVWRVSSTMTLWFFHRESEETWRAYCVPGEREPYCSPKMGGRELWDLLWSPS
jgi:hypothetical protein